jgi:amino acid transporter
MLVNKKVNFRALIVLVSFFCFSLICFIIAPSAYAQPVTPASPPAASGAAGTTVIPPTASTCAGDKCKIPNPLKDITTPELFIGQIIKAVLGVVGSLALLMFVYGGFLMLTAAGKAEKWKKGTDVLVWAIIGLVIIFTAYALVSFVITSLGVT